MKTWIVTLCILCFMAGCCTAPAPKHNPDDTDAKIQQLEKRVEQLEQQADEWGKPRVLPLK